MRIYSTLLLWMMCATLTWAQNVASVVIDSRSGDPLAGAVVSAVAQGKWQTITDADGRFELPQRMVGTKIRITILGYKTLTVTATRQGVYRMSEDISTLGEVVVTARTGQGQTTSSVIGRDAMRHLQPNSIADLMELLPGGYAKDPNMGQANLITLRETGTMGAYGTETRSNNYSITSLGTQFVIDGVPLMTDANLQYSPLGGTQSSTSSSSAEGSRNITNSGVDMRAISTDDIESVEVMRGIPSAEYGNLTSGLVNIRKIRRAMPLTVRFKADGYSKLFSAGKGVNLNRRGTSLLNMDLGYLDSKTDPTDNLENYKRLTASLRYTLKADRKAYSWSWNSALDYQGSFDNAKADPDLNYGHIDEYRSSYNRIAMTNNFMLKPRKSVWSEVAVNSMVSLQNDRLRQTRLVAPQRYGIVPLSWTDGENEAQAVFAEYIAHYLCDGKPFSAYVKAKGVMGFKTGRATHTLKLGLNWDIAKNFGRGQVYDMHRPLSVTGWSSRPRRYKDIPSLQNLSAFGEEQMRWSLGRSTIDLMAGLRLAMMPGLASRYDMSGRIYADPRINMGWHLPKLTVGGEPMAISLNAGYGITTKMPTLNYLYPDRYYSNFISLAYYDASSPAQNSCFVVHTYIQDPTNYHLSPARNHKWEVRVDLDWHDNTLSIDYFRETMNDGFRYAAIYGSYAYRAYDVSQMQAGRDYHSLPYTERQVLDGYQKAGNGSRLVKQGIELAFTSQRIHALRTRINVTGAWFRTLYTNSQPMFDAVSTVIDNQPVREQYVGLYDWNDGRLNDRVNTNVTFDTQIPEWRLIFTTSVQCMWMIHTRQMWKNGTPMAYIAASDGQLHPYTTESLNDPRLSQLTRNYNADLFRPFTVPMSAIVNLKVTKEIGRMMRLSFFANKILDYLPDYTANGRTIRRNASPYFGVEAGLSL